MSLKREKLKVWRKSWIGKLTLSMILSKFLFLKDFEPRKFSSKIRIKERCNNVFMKKKTYLGLRKLICAIDGERLFINMATGLNIYQ